MTDTPKLPEGYTVPAGYRWTGEIADAMLREREKGTK